MKVSRPDNQQHPWYRKQLTGTLVTAFVLLLAGCGGGGGTSPSAVSTAPAPPTQTPASFCRLTEDAYGLQNATYLAATATAETVTLRAAIAAGMTDPAFATVFRIDVAPTAGLGTPATYAVGGTAANLPPFPGTVYFFNGHPATLLKTVAGSITFTSCGTRPGDTIAGNFELLVEDGNAAITPRPIYPVKAVFSFVLEASGPVTPLVAPVPANGQAVYDGKCAGCHRLGSRDLAGSGAPDLALQGGSMSRMFIAGTAAHGGITLSAQDIQDLKVFLNAN